MGSQRVRQNLSVHGISQARILEWVAVHFLGDLPASPALAGGFFTTEPPGKPGSLSVSPGDKPGCSQVVW